MVEEQAAARVDRIGQTRPIVIYRYFVNNSIETVCYNQSHWILIQC